jgi:hypothetical protein
MQENQEYLNRTVPCYFQIQERDIIPLFIPFPLKPISFQRDGMFENILYEKFRERISYDYILLFGISPPENYLEIPFYFYSFEKDLYQSVDSSHPFYGLWYSLLKPNSQNDPKSPWYDIGKICEESSEIWIHDSQKLLIDLLMRLPLQKVLVKKIFFQNLLSSFIPSHYSKSITWKFVQMESYIKTSVF